MKSEVYVGGYTNTIEVFHLTREEEEAGTTSTALTHVASCEAEEKSSFLAVHGDRVYSIHELKEYDGKKSGAVSFMKSTDSKLSTLQCQPTAGQWTCHISLDTGRNCAYIPSYLSPYFSVTQIKEDGYLGADLYTKCYKDVPGSGVDPERQEASHPHSAYGRGKFIYVVDLGCDRIWHYEHGEHAIGPANPPFTATPPGSGPRHMAFHPVYNLAILVTELTNQVIVYKINENGSLTTLSSYDYMCLTKEENDGRKYGAEIKVHPNGKFLYVSVRSTCGKGCLVCYKILGESGDIEKVETVETGGRWPRNFNITSSGDVLLCADQFLNMIEVFTIDPSSGKLHRVETVSCNNSPACVVFKDIV